MKEKLRRLNMIYKQAICSAEILEIKESNKDFLIHTASRWASRDDFPQRYQKLFENYLKVQNFASVNSGVQRVGSYNPEFKYYRVIAMHGDIPNQNSDLFRFGSVDNPDEPELLRYDKELGKQVYCSFSGRGNYLNHQNDAVEKAVGIILDVAPNYEGKFIEALLAVDTIKAPGIIRDIDTGIISAVSMGAICGYSLCTACGNLAHSEREYCDCLKHHKGQKVYHEGSWKDVYEDNRSVCLIELSWVSVPADPDAKLLERVAGVSLSAESELLYTVYKQAMEDGKIVSADYKNLIISIKNDIDNKLKELN